MNIRELDTFISSLLKIKDFAGIDRSINGIQVETSKDIKNIVFSVDASIIAFERAKEMGADMIFCHHGIFWKGEDLALKGDFYKRVKFLLDNDIGLYACHLPLDEHEELGNNAYLVNKLAEKCGIKEKKRAYSYKGICIGHEIEIEQSASFATIYETLMENNNSLFFIERNERVKKIGIVSGGGLGSFQEAIEHEMDLFITGDANHIYYYKALENNTSLLCMGHYLSEMGGLFLVMNKLKLALGIECKFLKLCTGL